MSSPSLFSRPFRQILQARQVRRIGRPILRTTTSASASASRPGTKHDTETAAPDSLGTKDPLIDVDGLLSNPTWSVQSLLPADSRILQAFPVTPAKLRHLLRLSALPEPRDAAEEDEMMQTLAAQLHFVKKIQSVDTDGVEPMRAIRDETAAAEEESEITPEKLAAAFENEEVLGKVYKRIRRKRAVVVDHQRPENWNPLEKVSRSVGKYFVVDKTKDSK
jgi:Asp-tRNA(Asn)/Glu-tRNA(Gln) amidotransferase C subunit